MKLRFWESDPITREIYDEDVRNYKGKHSNVSKDINDARLDRLREIYGITSKLAAENGDKKREYIKYLSWLGVLLTIAFLLYDELEAHYLIIFCIVLLFAIIAIDLWSNYKNCHEKHLKYRMIAETTRVQFFLSAASIDTPVTELLPWFVQQDIPWLKDILSNPPVLPPHEKMPIINSWVEHQQSYHKSKIEPEEKKQRHNTYLTILIVIITMATYITTLCFELYLYKYPNTVINVDAFAAILNAMHHIWAMDGYTQIDMIRGFLKIAMGTASAASLFTASYYGKMSLSDSIKDHKRMNELYNKAKEDLKNGEPEEGVIELARHYLNENSAWYAYENQNKPDLVF